MGRENTFLTKIQEAITLKTYFKDFFLGGQLLSFFAHHKDIVAFPTKLL